MYVTVRKYADKGANIDRLVPPVRDGLVPLFERAPGFRDHCAFASEHGHIVSASVFDDRETAARATDQVRERVVSNQSDLLPDPPEAMAGEVRRELSGQARGGAEGRYVAVRRHDGVRSIERLAALADEHAPAPAGDASKRRPHAARLDR